MPKAKRRSSARAKSSRARKSIGAFMMGDSVRVIGGDYGNCHGRVESAQGDKVRVQLANHRAQVVEIDAANLVHGGAKDRV